MTNVPNAAEIGQDASINKPNLQAAGEFILIPQPSDDPADPLNWSLKAQGDHRSHPLSGPVRWHVCAVLRSDQPSAAGRPLWEDDAGDQLLRTFLLACHWRKSSVQL